MTECRAESIGENRQTVLNRIRVSYVRVSAWERSTFRSRGIFEKTTVRKTRAPPEGLRVRNPCGENGYLRESRRDGRAEKSNGNLCTKAREGRFR